MGLGTKKQRLSLLCRTALHWDKLGVPYGPKQAVMAYLTSASLTEVGDTLVSLAEGSGETPLLFKGQEDSFFSEVSYDAPESWYQLFVTLQTIQV